VVGRSVREARQGAPATAIGANPPVTGRRHGNAGSHEQPRIPGPRSPHGGPAFNGLFYATAATIIPVLFLAIAVQGPLYGDLLKASGATLRRFREHKAGASPRRLVMRLWIGSVLASSAAVAILIVTVSIPGTAAAAARHPSQRLTTYTGMSDCPWPSHKLAKWTQKPEASLQQIDLLAAHGRRAPVRGPRSRIGNKSAPTLARALAQ
jgi:hypothetical protein